MSQRRRGFVLIKPEAVQRNLVGRIIGLLEDKGLKIVGLKMLVPQREQVEQLYDGLRSLPYFERIIECTTDGPVMAVVVESVPGVDASDLLAELQGGWDVPGTIRHRFVAHKSRNVVHCSDSGGVAERELSIFFQEAELCSYEKVLDLWLAEHP